MLFTLVICAHFLILLFLYQVPLLWSLRFFAFRPVPIEEQLELRICFHLLWRGCLVVPSYLWSVRRASRFSYWVDYFWALIHHSPALAPRVLSWMVHHHVPQIWLLEHAMTNLGLLFLHTGSQAVVIFAGLLIIGCLSKSFIQMF